MTDDDRHLAWQDFSTVGATARRGNALERLKRLSLAEQAERIRWQLGALMRRAESEAPDVQARLRVAVEALQIVGARLAMTNEEPRHDEFF